MKRPDGFSTSRTPRSRSARSTRPAKQAKKVATAAAKQRTRAEKAEYKVFTQATRHRRRVWGISLGSIAAVVLGTVILVLSPVLALKEVRVEGAQRVTNEEIRTNLASLYGEPLARVSTERVGELLEPLTLIQSFTTRVEPPGTLVLEITERQPLGFVQKPPGFTVVDAAGVALWSTPEAPAGLPLILVAPDPDSPSYSAVARVLVALPSDISTQVEGITATTLDDVRFTIRQSSHEVVWGSAERSRAKARVLSAALTAAGSASPQVIDVTTPDSVVIRQRD
jgi:cell division protein FtsQ